MDEVALPLKSILSVTIEGRQMSIEPGSLAGTANIIARSCLHLQSGSQVLILSDQEHSAEGKALDHACRGLNAKVQRLDVSAEVERYRLTGLSEPGPEFGETLVNADLVVTVADPDYAHSLGHTEAIQKARLRGIRMGIVLYGLDDENISASDVDAIVSRTRQISSLLQGAKSFHLTTVAGSNLRLERPAARRVFSFTPGMDEWVGVIPYYAESTFAPDESTATGLLVVDGIVTGGVGKVDEPIRVSVQRGQVTGVEGGRSADRLWELMSSDANARTIAEIGVATSHLQKRAEEFRGDVPHHAYGAWRTIHIAFGENQTLDGATASKVHIDCQVYDPTLLADGRPVILGGRYQSEL